MINMYKKNIVLYSFYLTFILNLSLIFSYDCNDTSALNFNENSSSTDQCVYFDIPSYQETDEDIPFEVDLSSFASGYQSSNLLFTLDCSNIPDIESCLLIDNQLTIIFSDNYDSVSETMSLIVDYNGILVEDTFYISVNSINDAPIIISNNNTLQSSIDNLFEYVIEIEDVENDDIDFTLIWASVEVNLIPQASIAIINYTPLTLDGLSECDGSPCFIFTVEVSDGNLSDVETFTVEVLDNDIVLPVISILDFEDYNEDEEITVNFNISNVENFSFDDLSLWCIYSRNDRIENNSHTIVVESPENYKSTFQPWPNWNGEFEIRIIVDNQISFTTHTTSISLNPINDDPYITNYQNIHFNEGEHNEIDPFVHHITLNDSDQDVFVNENPFSFVDLNYTLSWVEDSNDGSGSNQVQNIDSDFIIDGSSNTVENRFFAYDNNWYGTEYFEVTINNVESGDISRDFPVTINNINDAPELTFIEDQVIDEDTSLVLTLFASDIEEDDLTYDAEVNGNADVSVTGDQLIVNPNNHYNGNLDLFITVGDGDKSVKDSFTLSIVEINDTPYTEDLTSILMEDDMNHLINIDGTIIDDLCNSEISSNSNNSIVCNCNELEQGACDIEDVNLTFKLLSNVSDGDLYLEADSDSELNTNDYLSNSTIYYNPNSNFFGLDEFTYEVCDQEPLCASGTVKLIINESNDTPIIDENTIGTTTNEDISKAINLSESVQDIEGDDLTFSITETPSNGLLYQDVDNSNIINLNAALDGSILYYKPNLHFNGDDSFSFSVTDGFSSIDAIYIITISPVNDSPVANEMDEVLIDEDISKEIMLTASDIELDILHFNIIDIPANGILTNNEGIVLDIDSNISIVPYDSEDSNDNLYMTTLTFQPHPDFIGNDSFSFIVSDMSDENSSSNIVTVDLRVQQVNDAPILNCPDDNCNLLLSEIVTIYEDCSSLETDNNELCNDADSIMIENMRSFYDDISNDICSEEHLWYDTDCNDSEDINDFDLGIAIDMTTAIDDIENNRGIWQYKEKDGDAFIDLSLSLLANCNFKLLDHEDQIRFIPYDNYHTTGDIQTLPSITFRAWDKTEYNDESCIISLENSTSFSLGTYTAQFNIISVNDSPVSDVIELGSAFKEYCSSEDNELCGDRIIEIPINFNDSFDSNGEIYNDNMFYYISSKTVSRNTQQSLFNNLEFSDDYYSISNLITPILNTEVLEYKEDGLLYLKLDLIEYVNGKAEVAIVAFDRENFSESLSTEQVFTIEIEQVNNKINQFQIINNISSYENYDSNIINNDNMIYPYNFTDEDDLYLTYPPYQYNNNPLTVDGINNDNFYSIREYMKNNPYEMDEIYFKWDRNLDSYLDYDIDQMLNDEPYDLYYRLEFLDQNNNVYVLKDSILENFTNLEHAYTKIKLSKGPYKKYINGEIYNPQSIPNALIDTTSLTLYNWRVTADNYSTNYEDIIPEYDFYTTSTEISNKEYAVNLNIPKLNYDFVLNDLYPNYYDLYLSPIPTNFTGINNYENITFNQNAETYVWNMLSNTDNNIASEETINIHEIDFGDNNLLNQNIFLAYDDLNSFGYYRFYIPVQNDVGNMNICRSDINYSRVIPNVYTQIESSSGNFNIEFMGESNFNLLLYEKKYNEITINENNFNILSDLFVIEVNNGEASEIKINYSIGDVVKSSNNISFAKYDNGNIYKIVSDVNNDILSADIEEFGSFVIISDNNTLDNEIPNETSILSCFPNPFNPSTTINYFLEQEADIKFKIFNISGQSIYNSSIISSKEGSNNFSWNALDDFGNQVPSGIYIVSMNLDDKVFSQKITFLK